MTPVTGPSWASTPLCQAEGRHGQKPIITPRREGTDLTTMTLTTLTMEHAHDAAMKTLKYEGDRESIMLTRGRNDPDHPDHGARA